MSFGSQIPFSKSSFVSTISKSAVINKKTEGGAEKKLFYVKKPQLSMKKNGTNNFEIKEGESTVAPRYPVS